jgi:hypothetical protein
VIPILVDEARMPRANELPPTLDPLVRLNAVTISPQMFDTERLIATVQQAAKAAADARRIRGNAQSPDEAHYPLIAHRILDGGVVPFLGAGVNLCGRPSEASFELGHYLPSGSEVAAYLAREVNYPYQDRTDLLRVSQYVDVMLGRGPLHEELHSVFDADYQPTAVHRLLASLPSLVRGRSSDQPRFFPLIVTTNYDVTLETAFKDAGEEYDLVSYLADGRERGRFLHTGPDGVPRVIVRPSDVELRFDARPVIAKILGTVNRDKRHGDSFVVTEDDYLGYLSDDDIGQLLPADIAERLTQTHFVFFGCSLDWNLRLVLSRLFPDDSWGWSSWAVLPSPESIEERSWSRRRVEVQAAPLEEYIDRLGAALISASTTTDQLS